jgi:septal ring factor EnvC (AmiA/AmiB activator)
MIKRVVVVLMTVAVVLAAAQVRTAGPPDTVSRAEVVLAAKQALEGASHNLSRWLTIIIIVVLLVAVVAAWRILTLDQRLSRVEDLRAAWETRFAETADEVLRMKRKLAETENKAGRLEDDIAALRPVGAEAATAQVAMVQSELVAVRERLDRAEEKLEAVADHTVVTKRERAAVEELVKTAEQARVAAEAAAASAERTAALAVAADPRLAAATERLDRAEERLEAVKDHTAVTKRERAAVEELVKTAGQARVAAEAAATRAERTAALATAADSLRTGDESLAQHRYLASVQAYARCLEALAASGTDDPELQFHALHNRALANLRQREFDAVLSDAAALEKVASERALGASRLLTGVTRLWQGAVAQALQDLAAAVETDPGTRAVILQDEDIAAWTAANPKKAGPVKKFIKTLDKKPKKPAATTVKKTSRRR